jgi:hypothetical protein
MKTTLLVGSVLLSALVLTLISPPPAEALETAPAIPAGADPVNIFDWALGAEPERTAPGALGGEPSTPELLQAALQAGEIDEPTALRYLSYALGSPEQLPDRFHSQTPWEGTLLLLGLDNELSALPANDLMRTSIQASLQGVCGASSAAMPNAYETPHFRFEYSEVRGGLTIQDYAEALERSWEVNVTRYGWGAPPSGLSSPGGNPRLLVRVDGLSGGLFGYVSTSGNYAGFVGDNPHTSWKETEAYASCMVLNRDYSGFPSGARASLQSTAAHEFHHMIQFGYGALSGANTPDIVFIEASATWVEDEVFDLANDNYYFLWPDFKVCMGNYTASPYGYWITLRGMTESFGVGYPGGGEDVLQLFWEQVSRKQATNMTAMDNALRTRGSNLADAFHKYAIAAKFNKPCTGDYASPYCLKEGPDYVLRRGAPLSNASLSSIGARYQGALADNFALTWIDLPTGETSYNVTLTNTAQGGGELRGSLVCDTGSQLVVTPLSQAAGSGQSAVAEGFQPAGCTSVTAVITNQALTGSGAGACTLREFTLALSAATAPPTEPVKPPADQQRDSQAIYFPLVTK